MFNHDDKFFVISHIDLVRVFFLLREEKRERRREGEENIHAETLKECRTNLTLIIYAE